MPRRFTRPGELTPLQDLCPPWFIRHVVSDWQVQFGQSGVSMNSLHRHIRTVPSSWALRLVWQHPAFCIMSQNVGLDESWPLWLLCTAAFWHRLRFCTALQTVHNHLTYGTWEGARFWKGFFKIQVTGCVFMINYKEPRRTERALAESQMFLYLQHSGDREWKNIGRFPPLMTLPVQMFNLTNVTRRLLMMPAVDQPLPSARALKWPFTT